MSVKLNVLGANQTEITVGEITLFFSYNTLVGIYGVSGKLPLGGVTRFFITEKSHSKTTKRHVNAWLGGAQPAVVSQEELETLAANLGDY